MRWPVYIYYLLMCCCFIASLSALRIFRVRLLAIYLFFSILVEILAEMVGVGGSHHFFLYHFFNIVEYLFVTWILADGLPPNRKQLRQIMLGSIVLYTLVSLWVSLRIDGLQHFPSVGTNIESVGIIAGCLVSFLTLEPKEDIPIHRRSVFWITLAFFVYFTGTFCFNSLYNTLLNSARHTAELLFSLINSLFNYFLYIFLIIGIKWSRQERKYSER